MSDREYESAFAQGFAPGTGPGAPDQVYVPPAELRHERALERNVVIGPLLVSTCRCPQCGTVYAYSAPLGKGGYAIALMDDEPDPPCWRCEVPLGVPLDPAEVHAMQQFRWRYEQYVDAHEVGAMQSLAQMRAAFLQFCSSAEYYAPQLLAALERRYGNQQDAGVQQILNEGV